MNVAVYTTNVGKMGPAEELSAARGRLATRIGDAHINGEAWTVEPPVRHAQSKGSPAAAFRIDEEGAALLFSGFPGPGEFHRWPPEAPLPSFIGPKGGAKAS